jgi:protein SCO1/2
MNLATLRGTAMLGATLLATLGLAQSESPIARSMGITQRIGETVPGDIKLVDEDGKTIWFDSLLNGRPLVIVPVFYACQTGCAIIQDNVMKTLAKAERGDRVVLGRDLDVVMVSMHPKETSDLARAKKQLILNALTPPSAPAQWRVDAEDHWRTLTGDEASVRHLLTDVLGFKYKYDREKNLINHPTGTIFVSPQGQIVAYTIGNNFPTRVVETNLDFAARNEVAPKADQSMMFGCIMLDPETGRYRPVVHNILRVACVLTVIALAGFIVTMNIQSKRKSPSGGGEVDLR